MGGIFMAGSILVGQKAQYREVIIVDKNRDITVQGSVKTIRFGVRGLTHNEIQERAERLRRFDKVSSLKIDDAPNKDGIYWGEISVDTSLQTHVLYRYLMSLGIEYINIEGNRKTAGEAIRDAQERKLRRNAAIPEKKTH